MQDINKIIETILWGKSYVRVQDNDLHLHSFILRSLSIKEVNFINYIYDREYDTAIREGVMSFEQLKALFSSNGVWTEDNDEEVKRLEKQEKFLQAQIKDFEFITSKRKKAEKEIKEVKEKIGEIRRDKAQLFNFSAETRAEEVMRRYMIMLSTEDIRERPYWPSEDDFLKESDFILVYNLAISYYQSNMFDEHTIRKIARSPNWRNKWAAFKNGADLFGRPIPDWSEMQNYLVYWSQFYDFVLESLERPGDMVVDSDEACDAWVADQSKKMKSQSKEKNLFGNKKSLHKKDHQEQFIMVQPGDGETIKKVQEMNTSDVRARLRNEYEVVKKEGRISEWNLRKDQLI